MCNAIYVLMLCSQHWLPTHHSSFCCFVLLRILYMHPVFPSYSPNLRKISVRFLLLLQNTMTKSKLRRKGLISSLQLTACSSSSLKLGAGSQRNLGGSNCSRDRPWRSIIEWLAPHDFLSLLSYSIRTTCPKEALHIVSWALSHQLSNRKMPYTLNYRPLLLKAFSKSAPFQSDSSLYQVDLITSSTPYMFTFQLLYLLVWFLSSFFPFFLCHCLSFIINSPPISFFFFF